MTRLLLMLALSAGEASASDPQRGASTFDAAWNAVTASYYDTTFAGMNWDSLGAAYRERAARAESDAELRRIIGDMINRLGDSHFQILSHSPLPMNAELRWSVMSTPEGRSVGLIQFDAWALESSQAFDQAVDQLRESDGIIVDLRGNAGGLIPMLIGVSGHFLNKPLVLGTLISRNNRIEIRANPRKINTQGEYVTPYGGPLAILVDEHSYSASEFFAAGMQGLGRGTLVGQPTTGMALGATYTLLPNGDVLEHAVSDFLSSAGERVEGVGVKPNLVAVADPVAAALHWVDARAVVDRYVALVGGAEAFASCEGRVATGTMRMPAQGLTGRLKIYSKAPDKMLMEVEIPGMGLMSSGFDGITGWMIQPMMGPMLLEGKSLEQLRVQSRADEPLKTHAGVRYLELVGEKTINGVACSAVKTVYAGDFELLEYYAKESGWLVGFEGEQDTPMGTLNMVTQVLAHGPCGDLQIPTRSSQVLMGMEQVLDIEDCRCADVADSIFALPPVIQTLKENQ